MPCTYSLFPRTPYKQKLSERGIPCGSQCLVRTAPPFYEICPSLAVAGGLSHNSDRLEKGVENYGKDSQIFRRRLATSAPSDVQNVGSASDASSLDAGRELSEKPRRFTERAVAVLPQQQTLRREIHTSIQHGIHQFLQNANGRHPPSNPPASIIERAASIIERAAGCRVCNEFRAPSEIPMKSRSRPLRQQTKSRRRRRSTHKKDAGVWVRGCTKIITHFASKRV